MTGDDDDDDQVGAQYRTEIPITEEEKAVHNAAKDRERSRLERRLAELNSNDDQGDQVDPLKMLEVRAAADRFLAHAYPKESDRPRAVFPWPGGDVAEREAHARPLPDGALLPEQDGYKPKPWERLHRKVGPMHADEVSVLVAPTKAGKTGWALAIAESAARHGAPVLYLSAELGQEELIARLLAMRARGDDRGEDRVDDRGDDREPGVSWSAVKEGRAPEQDARDACDNLCAACPSIYLWAAKMHERNVDSIRAMVLRVVAATDRAPLVVIDYLQRLVPGEDLRPEVRKLSGVLREISRPGSVNAEWPGCSALVLSSTARSNLDKLGSVAKLNQAHANGEPLESLGKESGEIETDATRIFVLATDPKDTGDGARDGLIVLAASRIGGEARFPFRFYGSSGRWVEANPLDAEAILKKMPEKKGSTKPHAGGGRRGDP
jgi:hypothetical protein